MKKKSIILIIIGLIIIIIGMFLFSNKTFFKTTYIGTNNKEIFIPRYYYFDKECCFTAATFYSLKSEKQLKKEISNYLKLCCRKSWIISKNYHNLLINKGFTLG